MIYSDVLQRLKNFNVVIDSDYKVSAVSNNLLESDIGITILNMHVNELFSKKVLFDDDKQGKENIENSGSAIQDIKDLKVRQFDWKDNIDTHKDFGFVAQELHSIIPEAVAVGSDELDDNGKPKQSWGVDYSHIVPRLVKAVQEQQTRIESLEAEVTALKNQP